MGTKYFNSNSFSLAYIYSYLVFCVEKPMLASFNAQSIWIFCTAITYIFWFYIWNTPLSILIMKLLFILCWWRYFHTIIHCHAITSVLYDTETVYWMYWVHGYMMCYYWVVSICFFEHPIGWNLNFGPKTINH